MKKVLTTGNIILFFAHYRFLKVAVVGIGHLGSNSTLAHTLRFLNIDITNLKNRGAVGDIVFHAFDGNGMILESELNQRVISVPLARLRELN